VTSSWFFLSTLAFVSSETRNSPD